MEKIVALHRNHFGDIISFQTSEGRIISYRKAIQEVENGLIDGLQINSNEDGIISLSPTSHSSFDDYPQIY
ncbi:MAG TPA: DUF3892 domain-containing protein [Pseudoneobacillus sp.]|nr:DUF3892 domain-containing protein [Pseudoneobacillus sp.]